MADKGVESDEESGEVTDLTNPNVITKYQTAAEIANKVLEQVVKECVAGKLIVELCILGDKLIMDAAALVYKSNKKMEKGIAFPTCISVNNIAGHVSPLADDTATLKDGDLVKVDLGVHIDGFISVIAHSLVVTATPEVATSGRKADVIAAAYYASEVAHRLIKPGNKNTQVSEAIMKCAAQFKCNTLEGVLSHELKHFTIDGEKVIINHPSLEHKVEEFEFEEGQVYAVDIVMSTGEGKAKEQETRTTVYKRQVDTNYSLKMKASRYVFSEINSRFPTFPFTLRALDEKRARLGMTEIVKHDLVTSYPVLIEKEGEFISQIKFTVLILPSETKRLNSHALPYISSEYKMEDPAINAIMQQGTKRVKKSKKKGKKKAEPAKEGEAKPAEAQPMETGK
jgi:curved DNA binding protein